MKCPSFLFAIKGLRTLEPDLVHNTIREMWNNEITQRFIIDGIQTMDENLRDGATQVIQSFLDSVLVTKLDTRDKGSTIKPTFNIYANGDIIDDVKSWVNIRAHLVNCNYHSTMLGQGKTDIIPFCCGLCHGVDHPRGMCPFPDLDGWKGPKKRIANLPHRPNPLNQWYPNRPTTPTFLLS